MLWIGVRSCISQQSAGIAVTKSLDRQAGMHLFMQLYHMFKCYIWNNTHKIAII